MSLKSKLVKAFAAVALFSAMTGIVPSPLTQTAEASPVSIAPSIAANTAVNAANAAAAAAHARHVREATNDVIVNPSAQNIANASDYSVVDNTTIPYINAAIADMNIKLGTKPDDITYEQRDQFTRLLEERRLVAEMSADNADGAVRLGMSSSLAPYFNAAKADLGYSGTVTLPQAQAIEARVKAEHWEKDTKPFLEKTAVVAGGVVLAGGAAYVIAKKKHEREYGY